MSVAGGDKPFQSLPVSKAGIRQEHLATKAPVQMNRRPINEFEPGAPDVISKVMGFEPVFHLLAIAEGNDSGFNPVGKQLSLGIGIAAGTQAELRRVMLRGGGIDIRLALSFSTASGQS